MAPRKKTLRSFQELDEVFGAPDSRCELPKLRPFACRQIAGPEQHDDLIISATDGVDAHRQFFNYYGLNEETFRYRLRVVEIEKTSPLVSKAIECQSPRLKGELTLDQLQQQQHEDIERQIKSGEAVAMAESV